MTVQAADIPVELPVAGQPQPIARSGVSAPLHTSGYIISRGLGCPGIPAWDVGALRGL